MTRTTISLLTLVLVGGAALGYRAYPSLLTYLDGPTPEPTAKPVDPTPAPSRAEGEPTTGRRAPYIKVTRVPAPEPVAEPTADPDGPIDYARLTRDLEDASQTLDRFNQKLLEAIAERTGTAPLPAPDEETIASSKTEAPTETTPASTLPGSDLH